MHRKLRMSDRNTKIFSKRNVEESSSMCRCAMMHQLKEVKRVMKQTTSSGCQNNPRGLFDKVSLKTFFVGHKVHAIISIT